MITSDSSKRGSRLALMILALNWWLFLQCSDGGVFWFTGRKAHKLADVLPVARKGVMQSPLFWQGPLCRGPF